jgi:hypothetical protein
MEVVLEAAIPMVIAALLAAATLTTATTTLVVAVSRKRTSWQCSNILLCTLTKIGELVLSKTPPA